ncbi:MAG: acetoacetate decarboxylase [Ralstonia sp.]|uniref:acetoacetate decarboxylase n=1 Tax=Ralstonia sp. TaxID=54061 RepID=UPI002580192F|nr:acetoacetate decarboxylase [Ralstonia sp.]MBA4234039.1 acetoacetate decarboxylase [Ralstonia sp.]
MNIADILQLPSMPLASPSYPRGPYRFIDREYFIITYESDPDAIRAALPEPLEPDGSNTVLYEFINMPDSSGFGSYTETGVVIPCLYQGEHLNFTAQMYLDCEPPISAGREIWGFPKKFANPKLSVEHDTLTGRIDYAGQSVAIATMAYKHENLTYDAASGTHDTAMIEAKMAKTNVNLKLIPDVDGTPAILQLVAYNLGNVSVVGGWAGPARLHLIPHVNAPVADLPVRRVIGGTHFIADLTLDYGRVLHDYLAEGAAQ